MKRRILCTSLIAVLLASLFGCASLPQERPQEDAVTITIDEVPVYSGDPYVVINDNEPSFSSEELESDSFESYGELDDLGRCTIAFANLSSELMPQGERGSIGQVKPSGWQTARYDSVDGKYLYNRCHLIGWQLSGENANERNLITGTRYMNTEGMLPFENMVADHIKETDGHVLYRVTPIFVEDELVARGVQMEAYSIEDAGASICFNVFVYNVQPGIEIDYSDGSSRLSETADESQEDGVIRGNSRSKIYHCPGQAAGYRKAQR